MQFTGHHRDPIIVLDVVCSEDLWIWNCFFGLPESLNNITVLQDLIYLLGLLLEMPGLQNTS
jgi:hypothetical protein